MSDYLGKEIFKLGFGLMRLPKLEDGKIDVEQVKVMADMFIENGGIYFDTAYVYNNGESEEVFRKAVAERYPRDAYYVCTKLNAMMQCEDEASAKQQFYTSLERTGAGYFDFYLLHALSRKNYHKYDEYHIWDFVKQLKKEGLVKNYGFSFHGDPDLLEELLNKHPDVDFIQLQINYADWDNPGVAAGKNFEIARRHNKPITVMEPIKGGALANPDDNIKAIFDKANPDASYASWAIRYVASLDGIITVLSGMSDIQQMQDNLSYMKDFKPLNDKEKQVINDVIEQMHKDKTIACTACHYCTDGCPKAIPIPDIFAIKNNEYRKASWDNGKGAYMIATANKSKASDCIECGQCEAVCPQQLPIIDLLKQCREME